MTLKSQTIKMLSQHVQKKAQTARLSGGSRPIVDELVLGLLTDAGLKPKEICSLNIGDIVKAGAARSVRIVSPRKKPARQVPISPSTMHAIDYYLKAFRKNAGKAEPLLLNERNNRLSYISVYNKVKKIGRECGLDTLTPSILRKAYMARIFREDGDLRFVQQQVGHASYKTTARFLQQTTPPKRESAICEACEQQVPAFQTTTIDSGQVLCVACLKEIRQVP